MFTQGLLFGLAVAAPVGPIGLLCIHRSLQHGHLAGFLSGMGAATADAFYGSVAAFGLTLVTGFLVAQQQWLQLGGGLFIIYLGLRTLRTQPPIDPALENQQDSAAANNPITMYGSTLLLTLSNPVTILSFTAVFAGFGLGGAAHTPLAAITLVLGVFIGSAMWWLTLSTLVGWLRHRLHARALRIINILSGLFLVVFGIVLLVQV